MYQSLLTKEHRRNDALWCKLGDNELVAGFGETSDERSRIFASLSIIDLSPLARFGLKGSDPTTWLTSGNYDVGTSSNRAYPQNDGNLVVRLSPGELLLLSNPATPLAEPAIDHAERSTSKCYAVRRQDSHYWLAVSGNYAPSMIAKLCGVSVATDDFDLHAVAQTSVARTSAIIIRNDFNDIACFYLLGDISTVSYMWHCLGDAMAEFGGRQLGLSAFDGGHEVQ